MAKLTTAICIIIAIGVIAGVAFYTADNENWDDSASDSNPTTPDTPPKDDSKEDNPKEDDTGKFLVNFSIRDIDGFVYYSSYYKSIQTSKPFSGEKYRVIDWIVVNNSSKNINYNTSSFELSTATGKTMSTYFMNDEHEGYKTTITIPSGESQTFTMLYSLNETEQKEYTFVKYPSELTSDRTIEVPKSSDGDELKYRVKYSYTLSLQSAIPGYYTALTPNPGYQYAVVEIKFTNNNSVGIHPYTDFILQSSTSEYKNDSSATFGYNKTMYQVKSYLSSVNIAPNYTYTYALIYEVPLSDSGFKLKTPSFSIYNFN